MAIIQNDIQRDICNDLVKGIVARLYAVFGSGYTFYAEDVPQGFKTPSFAVISMNPLKSSGMGIRKYWEFPFDVHYFCNTSSPRSEWNTIEQRLALELDRITACNTSLRAEIQPSNFDSEQDVGHFYCVYGLHLLDVYPELDKMECLHYGDENPTGEIDETTLEFVAGDCECETP